MPPPKPACSHDPAIYQAIILEHDGSAERLGERLQALGWHLGDAAWAAVHWPLVLLAAAVAHERQARGQSLAGLPSPPPSQDRCEPRQAGLYAW